jgi:hypothetical protein
MLDYKRSLSIAQKMGNVPQTCWANVVRALRTHRRQLGNVMYVEGWCAAPEIDFVGEHGWLELEDGTILDPTYAARDNEDGKRLHYEYFPALHYRPEELKGVRLHQLPLVYKTGGFGGMRNEAYKTAYVNAYRHIGIDVTQVSRPRAKE